MEWTINISITSSKTWIQSDSCYCRTNFFLTLQHHTVKACTISYTSEWWGEWRWGALCESMCVADFLYQLTTRSARDRSLGCSAECESHPSETKPVGSSANGQTAGPPSVAGTTESRERVDLDCVLKGRSLPAVRQTHPHLQVHLQWGRGGI